MSGGPCRGCSSSRTGCPITVTQKDGRLEVAKSTGGLATGLAGPHERGDGLWIGWPGDTGDLGAAERAEVAERLAALRAVPVWLAADEAKRFYEGFCNSVLWPVFHYLLDQLPIHWSEPDRARPRLGEVGADVGREAIGPAPLCPARLR